MTTPMYPCLRRLLSCQRAGARAIMSATLFSNSSSVNLGGMVSAGLVVLVVVEDSVVTDELLVVGGLVVEVVVPEATARASYSQMTVQPGAFHRPAWICMVAPGEAEDIFSALEKN